MDINRFTEKLASCLSRLTPDGITVSAQDGILQYSVDPVGPFSSKNGTSGSYIRSNFDLSGDSEEERIINVSVQALDELQDFVSEVTSDPWPGEARQPQPRGNVRDSYLYLWYGDSESPILACEPIALADLAS
jgi:hypothetical protein